VTRTLITVPACARRGDVIQISVLIQHPMETGYRRSSQGEMLARDLIRRFSCRFEERGKPGSSEPVFSAQLYAAIAANPVLAFHALVNASGVFVFSWEGDNGFAQTERAALSVS
jgi:sulfur-oxidizing protein SoxZ